MGVKSYNLQTLPGGDRVDAATTEFGPSIISREDQVNDNVEGKSKSKKSKDSKDGLTSIIGEFGKFQLIFCLAIGSSNLVLNWVNVSNKFYNSKVDYWCAQPDGLNLTTDQWRNLSSPMTEVDEYDGCRIFDIDYNDTDVERPPEDTPTIKCSNWEYDTTHFKLGVIAMGMVADWYGRKRAFHIFLTLSIAFCIVTYFIDNPYAWIAIRFCVGAAQMAAATARSVYTLELVSGYWRSPTQHWFADSFFQIGLMTFGGIVYLIPDMKHMELFIVFAQIPHWLLTFFVPESPRWQLTMGKVNEAKKTLEKAIKWNKKPESNIDLVKPINEKKKKLNLTHILKHPAMRRNLLALLLCWLSTSMGYYGLVYNTPTFDWNVYLVFVFPAFFTLPVVLVSPILENRLGRKIMLFGTLAIAGLSLLATALVPDGKFVYNWPIVALCWLGTIASNAAFGANYVITKELFPTPLRSIALSTCSAFARIGSLSSPFVYMLSEISPVLSLVVYGSFLVAGALSSILVWPETKSHKMTESIEECEEISSTKNTWLTCSCCCRK